jgi:hypothetical protein
MNGGPLSAVIRGLPQGNPSRARWVFCSASASVIASQFAHRMVGEGKW